MSGYALLGALIAGGYGAVHDQLSYTLSPEYFTKLKFDQFAYADFGGSRRVFVATIGFLASWWVGGLSVWFLGRVRLPREPKEPARVRRDMGAAFALLLASTIIGGATGLAAGHWFPKTVIPIDMVDYWVIQGVTDIPAFTQVAGLHNGSYAGGFLGLLLCLFLVRRNSSSPSNS